MPPRKVDRNGPLLLGLLAGMLILLNIEAIPIGQSTSGNTPLLWLGLFLAVLAVCEIGNLLNSTSRWAGWCLLGFVVLATIVIFAAAPFKKESSLFPPSRLPFISALTVTLALGWSLERTSLGGWRSPLWFRMATPTFLLAVLVVLGLQNMDYGQQLSFFLMIIPAVMATEAFMDERWPAEPPGQERHPRRALVAAIAISLVAWFYGYIYGWSFWTT